MVENKTILGYVCSLCIGFSMGLMLQYSYIKDISNKKYTKTIMQDRNKDGLEDMVIQFKDGKEMVLYAHKDKNNKYELK